PPMNAPEVSSQSRPDPCATLHTTTAKGRWTPMTAARPRWTAAAVAACLTIVGTLTACDPGPTPDPPPPSSSSSTTTSKNDPSPSPTPTVSEEDQAYAAAEKAYTEANRIIDITVNKGE